MEDLARRLCEAVENEDAPEVGNLLECGADPNLVLPNGIAAIHLASGKESESALRCLSLILHRGGNPNVRSTDDLTPVHVAASWGCCKALTFLLRKGGDPSIQDQDGNTALDLALMENNRRCVVTLQEYRERMEIRSGCDKDSSSLPNDISDVSCIALLLESTYNKSPLSSTKISLFPKTVTPENHMDVAARSIKVEMPSMYAEDDCRIEQARDCTTRTTRKKCEVNPTEAKVAVPVTRTSPSSDCSEYFSSCGGSDVALDNSSTNKNLNCDLPFKTRPLVNHKREDTRNAINGAMTLNAPLSSTLGSAVTLDLQSNRELGFNYSRTDLQVSGEVEGLDAPPPDHVHTYNKEEDNKENALLMCGSSSPTKNLNEQETCSRRNSSDCNTSLWESGDRRWVSHRTDRSFQDPNGPGNQGKGDATVLCKKCTCKTINGESQGLVNPFNEDMRAVENEELTGACTQIINCERKGNCVSTSQMQHTSQSPTLPVEDTCVHGTQNLQIQLRNLLLSTKGCHKPGPEAAYMDTIPVQHGHGPHQKVETESSSSSSSCPEDTFIRESQEPHVTEKGDCELNADLEKFMMPTSCHSLSTPREDKNPFFTPRTKSRLHLFTFRQNISALFDDTVEMPKRGRRVRSPEGMLATSTYDDILLRKSSCSSNKVHEPTKTSETSETLVKKLPEVTLTNQILQDQTENLCDPESTLGTSNFLTDDLSSETEVKSCIKQTTRNHCSGGISDSAWLTEDGGSEVIGNQTHKDHSTTPENSLPASFFHSTFVEDTDVNSCRLPRYSFSRLSSIPKADESSVQSFPSTGHDYASQQVPLSPGGRPVIGGLVEPVEYLYKDNDKGHVLIEKHVPSRDQSGTDTAGSSDNTVIYDWRNYKSSTLTINKASSVDSPNRVAVELYRLSNAEIASRLQGLGEDPGQVTSQNRKMCILLLDRRLKEQTSNRPVGFSCDFSPELSLALNTFTIPDCNNDEAELSRDFDQPDKTRKWREGVLKSSFNYLLLDPRVTGNLPSRCHDVSPLDCFRTFVSAVFYVGKGKRCRPYSHLYEALTLYKGGSRQPCSKVQHILDIWKSGQGVLSLHCFQNTIPVEAYTREACMVDAIGLKMLTNQKKGIYYGQAQNWPPIRRRRLGVHMLYKAMQIFLAEGERQLRPPDIRSGQ